MTDFVFSTYMKNNGSYYWLCQKLKDAAHETGHNAVCISDVMNYHGPVLRDFIHIHITSYNAAADFIKSQARRRFGHTYILADSVLISQPLLQIPEWEHKYNVTFIATSIYNYYRYSKFIKIKFMPHVVPEDRFVDFTNRKYWFIVGANEADYDRKGMYLAYWLQEAGFPIKAHCHNLCPPGFAKPNLSNAQMDKLWDDVKWYLAFSHAESPHLPLIESYLHGIPSYYHDATEMHWLGIGVPLKTNRAEIRGHKAVVAWEYDYGDLWNSVAKVYKFDEDKYRALSNDVYKFAKKWFGRDRIKDLEHLDSVEYNPEDIIREVEEIRHVYT